MSSCIIIPARLESTRLPRKLLLSETGKPLLQHTYEQAVLARKPDQVWIAADDQCLIDAAHSFDAPVQMTSPRAASGTDRVAELAARLPDFDIVLNLQGDEPEVSPASIDLAIALLEEDPRAVMSTLASPIRSAEQFLDPACVKVVCDQFGKALYFSRAPIPYTRSTTADEPPTFAHHLQHIGIYAYRRQFLAHLTTLPVSALESLEKLEQLRVLSAGYSIQVGIVNEVCSGIDTRADYDAFLSRWQSAQLEPAEG